MTLTKKLIFAPLFLISFAFLLYQLNPLFKSYDFIFTLSVSTIIQLIVLAAFISLTGLFFVLFASFVYDWKLVLVVGVLASTLPMFFVRSDPGLILSVGILTILLLTYLGLEKTLKNYLNFEPGALFGPHIRRLATFLILIISLAYFLSISKNIYERGFQIPDSLIEQALKLTTPPQEANQQQATTLKLSIPPEQIELLKQNPDLLKRAVKEQLEGVIKPYLGIIPGILALLFFFIMQSLVTLLNLLIYPLLWGIFYIFEKTGFIKFTQEQRTVKKMVV